MSIEKAVVTPANRFCEILFKILKQCYENRQKDTSLSLWNERNANMQKEKKKKKDVK